MKNKIVYDGPEFVRYLWSAVLNLWILSVRFTFLKLANQKILKSWKNIFNRILENTIFRKKKTNDFDSLFIYNSFFN